MNKSFLFVLLLLFIPMAHAAPNVASYWGYVTLDGASTANASVTVIDPSGTTVASNISKLDATYTVFVPYVSGQTITFKVNGYTATSRTIDAQGSSIRLDLSASSSSTGGNTGGTGGSSGGGGGGGGPSGENFSNIIVKEDYDLFIFKDTSTSYVFKSKDNPVSHVNISGNVNAGEINVAVEVLKDTSTLVKIKPPGVVYKNVNIWVGTTGFALPKNIKEAVIKFKVANSWMSENGASGSDIVLVKWDGSNWVQLETKESSKEGDSTIFEAKTNAFSPFAIISTKGITVPTVPAMPSGATAVTTEKQETPEPVTTEKSPGFGVVLAIAGLMAVIFRKRRY